MRRYQLQESGEVTLEGGRASDKVMAFVVCMNAHNHGVPNVCAFIADSMDIALQHQPRCPGSNKRLAESKEREVLFTVPFQQNLERVVDRIVDEKLKPAVLPAVDSSMPADVVDKWFSNMNWRKALLDSMKEAKENLGADDDAFDLDDDVDIRPSQWRQVKGNKERF